MNFDRILEKIGPLGKYQWYHYVLIGIGALPCGMNNMANVFLAATPEHSCRTTSLPVAQNNEFLTAIRPEIDDITCTTYDINHTEFLLTNGFNGTGELWVEHDANTSECKQWMYDKELYGQTIVSRWNLVCADAWLKSLASSIYMLGFLFGTVVTGSLADRFGRKPAWVSTSAVMAVFGIIAAFVPNYWVHVFLRMVTGFGAGGTFTTGFVLSMESIAGEKRMAMGLFYQGWFALGYMILPFLALLIKNYQYLMVAISSLAAISCINWCLLTESPRWLLTQQKIEECRHVLKIAARMNGTEYPHELIEAEATHLITKQKETNESDKHTVIDLVRTPNMRRKSLNIFYNWFVNSFVYYGLSLGVSGLVGSPYLNMFLSGFVEFPAFALCTVLVNKIGRRWPLGVMMASGGVCCLVSTIIPYDMGVLMTVLNLLGKFCISGSFCIIYVFSGELYPTVVRTTGVGTGSMHARIGGLLAPFVADLGDLAWGPLPFIIFGACALLGGGLALLLPETLHKKLPETLDDGERFGRNTVGCCGSGTGDSINDEDVEEIIHLKNSVS